MNIAYILPSLNGTAPVIVIQLLSSLMLKNGHACEVFYFDDKKSIDFDCPTQKIEMNVSIDFSQFDVIHSTGMRPDLYVAKFREYSGKTKYITTIHNFFIEDFTSQYNWLIAQFFGRRWMKSVDKLDKAVLLSRVAVKYYKKWIKEATLTYAYNARSIDLDQKIDFPIEKKGFNVIGINAMLSPIKGVEQVIKALPSLPEYMLFIAGDGKSRLDLERLAIKIGVNDRCYFAGYVKDAYRFMKFYDIYVACSRSEGFGLMLLEAAQYKVSTVCSKIPVFEEIFSPGEVSFFELDNIASLVDAIKNVPNGKKMYGRYKKCYTPQKMYERYLEIYNGKI